MLLGVLRPFAMAAKIEGLANIGEAMVLRRVRCFVVAICLKTAARAEFAPAL